MGLRAGINAKCKDCIYDPLAGGTWRQQVQACIDTTCGLHPYRPRSAAPVGIGQNGAETDASGENQEAA